MGYDTKIKENKVEARRDILVREGGVIRKIFSIQAQKPDVTPYIFTLIFIEGGCPPLVRGVRGI